MPYKYKTKDGQQTGVVAGVGVIVNGEIESLIPIESPNLELVTDQPQNGIVGTAPSTANVVTQATPVLPTEQTTNKEEKI